jgi:hypothetical protein
MSFSISDRQTKVVNLPSFEGCTVTVYTSLPLREQKELQKKYPNSGDQQSDDAQNLGIETLLRCIVKWDFDEKVTMENLLELPTTDALTVLEVVTGKKLLNAEQPGEITDAKKKSS